MKKYAMLMLNPKFESQKFQINADNIEHHIIMICSEKEAFEQVVKLADSGFGAIEVCGAFGEETAKCLYEATDKRVPVGYVIYPENHLEALTAFWNSKI